LTKKQLVGPSIVIDSSCWIFLAFKINMPF